MQKSPRVALLLALVLSLGSLAARAEEAKQTNLKVAGFAAWVKAPAKPAEGNPWVWRARFPGFHSEIDKVLLERGFHIAFIKTDGLLGAPKAMEAWDAFYTQVVKQFELNEKVALEAVSRGGLFAYTWAKLHPERIACIYGDTAVCDFKSWPLGQGTGIGSKPTWATLLKHYGFTHEEALAYDNQPIDNLGPLAKAGIPILHIVSENDRVVPPTENTDVLAKRYRELGGQIEVVRVKEGTEKTKGHHFTVPKEHIEKAAAFFEAAYQ